jgi:dienelactone hydrolase
VTKIADHYERLIRELDSPPIVMGHSMGGMITQLLVDRGLLAGAERVAEHGKGDANRGERQVGHALHGRPDKVYERYYVPAANRVLFQVGLANLTPNAPTMVDFTRTDRAPLLFAAFGEDHVVPAKASRHNAGKYRKSTAVTEFKEFPGRPRFPGAPGWEEVADYALDWAVRHARRS